MKQVYADIAAEPVPDRFLDLIEQLESDSNSGSGTKAADRQDGRS